MPGTYTLSAVGDEIRRVQVEVLVENVDVEGVELIVSAAHDLTGVVTSGDSGDPLAGAVVRVGDVEVTTGEEGTYAFEDLAPGIYTVTAEAEGYTPATTELELSASQTWDISLVPIARFGLTVQVERSDGGPAGGALVALAGGDWSEGAVEADGEGVARFEGLRSGNYRLAVNLAGYQELTVETIPIVSNAALVVTLVADTRQPAVSTSEKFECSASPAAPSHWRALRALGALVFRAASR